MGGIRDMTDQEVLKRFDENRRARRSTLSEPGYHFTSPDGILNDPNGFLYWRGRYHLFYQYHPQGLPVHWGHAVSTDLIRWRDMPPAIRPADQSNVFSGQALVEQDRVIAIYHLTGQGNCIATASDEMLLRLNPIPENPVIPSFTKDGEPTPYYVFDPCIWKEEDGYYALSGGRTNKNAGYVKDGCKNTYPLFHSDDLIHWTHLGELLEDGFFTEPGEDGAVPNFLPISENRHLLLFFSHKRAAQYYIGTYDKAAHRFTPLTHGRMVYNKMLRGALHAPSATIAPDGRILAIFNIKNDKWNQDIDSIMSLPRELSVDGEDRLHIEPARELLALRGEAVRVEPMDIPSNACVSLPDVHGTSMELDLTIDPMHAREVGLYVFDSGDGRERTRISLYRDRVWKYGVSTLQIDVSESTLMEGVVGRPPELGPLEIDEGEPLHLRVFIDRCVVEVFANGLQCLTLRVSPSLAHSDGVSLFSRGGPARLLAMDAYPMDTDCDEQGGDPNACPEV